MRPSTVHITLAFCVVSVLLFGSILTSSVPIQVNASQGMQALKLQATGTLTLAPRRNGINVCPDESKAIATLTSVPTRPPATAGTLVPTFVYQARISNITQTAEFDMLHYIVDYPSGVLVSTSYLGPISFIVIDGEVTTCRGSVQRIYKAGEGFTLGANQFIQIANTSDSVARLSVARIRPRETITPTLNVTATFSTTAPGYLGIRVVALNKSQLRISQVFGGSPAAAAGLQVDDVITALNGNPLSSMVDQSGPDYALITAFFNFIESQPPGTPIRLLVQRGNTATEITVTLGSQPT
jgi:hypothetical protein